MSGNDVTKLTDTNRLTDTTNFFTQFKDQMDSEFHKEISEIEKLNEILEFDKVPDGIYRIEIFDMQVKKSNKGNWMVQCGFKILEGQYENHCIWAYFVIKNTTVNRVNKFLKSLMTDVKIEFADINQYTDLVHDIFITVRGFYEYDIKQITSDTGFRNYYINCRYNKPDEELPFS